MVALFVQTLLLMLAAYFLGAALACLIRRSFSSETARPVPTERRVDPLPDVLQRAGEPNRFGRALEGGARPGPPVPVAPPPLKPTPVAPPAVATAAEPAQDLKRIHLIDAATEAGLYKLGVRRYEQIAAWMQGDIKRVGMALGLQDRINRENWIEQAQVLAKGGETNYAKRRARGEGASAAPTPDEGRTPRAASPPPGMSPRPSTGGAAGVVADVSVAALAARPLIPVAQSAAPPNVSDRAAFADRQPAAPSAIPAVQPSAPVAARAVDPAPAVPVRPAAPVAADNLLRIGGIDAAISAVLAAAGVTRYSQIAHWSPVDVTRFDQQLGGTGRIARENWLEQAQILSRGGDTAFSREFDRRSGVAATPPLRPAKLAEAIREQAVAKAGGDEHPAPRPDLSALRSVRSEAYQNNPEPGPAAAQRAAAQNKVLRSAPLNDLKRIRGIGVLIEKKLNSMGVTQYEQIANWRAADIDRVSQTLDFKGRIERENWVEQARILAAGGATEFSRRVDRGEVETSRYRP